MADSIELTDETLQVAEPFGVPTLLVDNEDGDFEANEGRLLDVLRRSYAPPNLQVDQNPA